MAKTAHLHRYDLHTNTFGETRARCLICGFAVPLTMLSSRTSLDAITARKWATDRLRAILDPDPMEADERLENYR